MTQHPIYALLLSIMVVVVFVQNSLQKGKILKVRLIFSFLNVFAVIVLWIMYDIFKGDEIFEVVYSGCMIAEYILFGVLMFFISYSYIQKMQNYNNFISSFKNTTFNVFFITDKKDRIKEISESLLMEMGLKKEEVIGKRFFEVANKSIRFFKLDDTEISNELLDQYYKDFPKTVSQNDEFKREIYFYNKNGQTVVLSLLEKPIFSYGKYKGRMNVGQRKDDTTLLAIEKQLLSKNHALESVQHKFIAALELIDSGLFVYDIDESYIWCNDILVKQLNLSSNTISVSDFHMLINKDDLYAYKNVIDNLDPVNPNYNVTYRFRIGHNDIYVHERGKRIFEDENSKSILGFIQVDTGNYFARTNYKHLDEIKFEDDLITDLNHLLNSNRKFDLVTFKTINLPDINQQHNRKIGDMVLAQCISQVKTQFLSESSDIYRLGGTDFVFTITDPNKIEFLRKALKSGSSFLNTSCKYGAITVVLEVNLGISQSFVDASDAKELLNTSRRALNSTLNQMSPTCYAYNKEVKYD